MNPPRIKTHAELHAMYSGIAQDARRDGKTATAKWAEAMRDRYAPTTGAGTIDELLRRMQE